MAKGRQAGPARRLAGVLLSDSFESVWPELAAAVGAEWWPLEDPCESAPASVVGAIVAAAGAEDRVAEAVRDLRAAGYEAPAVVVARADHRRAVEWVRRGASEVFVLPDDLDRLRDWVRDRAAAAAAREARARWTEADRRAFDFSRIIGQSAAMREALRKAARVIPRDRATVLLTGETGTGKELLAQAIHANGPRAAGPFVELNCSAIPGNLLEAELFGYERGAFTDARRSKPGLVEVAAGGTLFLDEVGTLPLDLQGKLLKALEEKRVRRLGATRAIDVDVRIIAATNTDLREAVRAGQFREDLYYRLSVLVIHLPPLRERGDDVVLLAEHFLDTFSREYEVPRPELTPELRRRLREYAWPGNVRELRNAIERALLLSEDGRLDPDHLFPEGGPAAAPGAGAGVLPFPAPWAVIEEAAAVRTVEWCGGNKSEAARRLGISRSRLLRVLARAERRSRRSA
jgi:two-component system response regulator HydG